MELSENAIIDRLDCEQTEENAHNILKERQMLITGGVLTLDDFNVDIYALVAKPGTVYMRWYRKGLDKPPQPKAKHIVWEG